MKAKADIIAPEPIAPDTYLASRWGAVADADTSGAITLPAGLRTAIRGYNRTHEAHAAAQVAYLERFPLGWEQHRINATGRDLARRALATGELPGNLSAAILEDRTIEAELGLRRKLLEQAAEESERTLDNLMSDAAILPSLREALDAVYGEVRRLPADTPRTAAEALDAEPGQIDAYRRLQALLGRHSAIRDAQAALRRRIPSKDGRNLFLDSPIAPSTGKAATIGAAIAPAGPPVGTVERLLWLAHDGTGWCPTVAEQDRAFTEWVEATSVTTPGLQFAAHGDTRAIR
ncbi:MAG: hypothetical protein M0Z49_02205 [Chloroflexi bacterium]|nr:hypothetical protein [Chloroflexota bacterium]